MARQQRKSAHAQLDEHRQRVASESMRLRELQEQQARARAELERIGDGIASAYASEDADAIAKARQAKEDAMARVEDLEHHVAGVKLRAQQAKRELDEFMAANSRDLLDEREETAREVATELTEAVARAVKAARAYEAERQHLDQLVARIPGAQPRLDGVPTAFHWQDVLRELDRAYREHPEAEPPRPRWFGMTYRRHEDETHRRLQAQRGKKPVDVIHPGG
jgi:DNA repair exonuclease SbcCD ATPase subunit